MLLICQLSDGEIPRKTVPAVGGNNEEQFQETENVGPCM